MDTKITVGLCVKNGAESVKVSFDSISIQNYPHNLMRLVFVDDKSTDNTLSIAMKFAQESDISTLVIVSEGKGLGSTRQIAVDNAEGDYIVWVDDDFVLSRDFLRKQVEFMENNPDIGAARCIDNIIRTKKSIIDIAHYDGLLFSNTKGLDSIGTGGSIFRLKALRDAGGFDIKIKGAGEDIDLSQRIRESGWKLGFNNSTEIFQKHNPTTLKEIWKKNFWYGYGNHYLFHKNRNQQLLKGYFPPLVLWLGIKFSFLIYLKTKTKKSFFFTIFHCFAMGANYLGFVRGNRDGYGHSSDV